MQNSWFKLTWLVALALLWSVEANAETKDWFKGSYIVTLNGEEVAKEGFTFRVNSETGALYVSGDTGGKQPEEGRLQEFLLNTHLTLKAEQGFKKYKQWILTGVRRKQDVIFPFKGKVRISWGKWGPKKPDLLDVEPTEGFQVLHPKVFHFYSLFSRSYGDSIGPMTVPFLDVSDGTVGSFEMERMGVAALKGKSGGKEFDVVRFSWKGNKGRFFTDKKGRVHGVERGRCSARDYYCGHTRTKVHPSTKPSTSGC